MRKLVVWSVVLGLVGLAVAAAYLYLQRERLIERAIEHYGTQILGASVQVNSVELSPVDGKGAVRGLRIGAPAGFTLEVFQAESIELAVDPKTVADEAVRIRRIAIVGPHVAYEQGKAGDNLNALKRNVARHIGETSPAERRTERKFIVDQLVIRGARLTYVPLSGLSDAKAALELPDITLNNIGKDRGGVTAGELTQLVVDALIARTARALGQRLMDQTINRLFRR